MPNAFALIDQQIRTHSSNLQFTNKGWQPIYSVSPLTKIIILSQAPSRKAQISGIPWGDTSGNNLRRWLGVDSAKFYDTSQFGILPMDFYYPGKGVTGDLPPRIEFAGIWHKLILDELTNLKLILLVGQYAQKYYLKSSCKSNLTETVRSFQDYLPTYFPLPHPSPLNSRWLANNPWFEQNVAPELQQIVAGIL